SNVMVISESLAEEAGLTVGDTLTLPSADGTTDFTVVGRITSRSLPGVEEVYVPLAAAQSLFDQPGLVNTMEAVYRPEADRAVVEAAVQSRLGDGFKLGQLEAGTALLANMQVATIAINLFGVMALVMGGFIIFNTFRTVVAERRHDIGLLRSVGAARRTILALILTESVLQGVIGTAVGIVAGYLLILGFLGLLGSLYEQFLHFSIGGPVLRWPIFAAAIALGVGVTIVGAIAPALAASRVTPLEALRPATSEGYRRAAGRSGLVGVVLVILAMATLASGNAGLVTLGGVLFVLGLVLVAPALIDPIARLFGRLLVIAFAREGQIAQGNLVRQPGRAAVTASAMMVGLAILVAMVGVMTSITDGFLGYLDRSLGADYLFMPTSIILAGGNAGAGPELAAAIGTTSGIEAVTTLRLATTETGGKALQLVGIDPATYPAVSGLVFTAGDEATIYDGLAGGRAIVVNGIFAAQNQVKVGETLPLQTPEGVREYEVVGVGMDYLNAKLATAYVSQANLAQDFHQTADLLLMANRAAGADGQQVGAALTKVAAGYPAFTLFDSSSWRATQEEIFTQALVVFHMMLVFLAAPSLIALVNTLVINVLERTREIGMMRAVGATRRQVQRLILAESLLLAATGTAFGILAGLWLSYTLTSAMTAAGFPLPYYFPYVGILFTIAVGLLFGVLASLLPARQAAKLDIVTALRYE
ncbi:MAG: FtsX-like permease family protein, partial [Chloroflexota bacterium]